MSSAFFRRPGEDSSDISSDEDTEDLDESHERAVSAVLPEIEITKTESLSTEPAPADPEQANILDLDKHRDLMFATLLEEFCKTRAAELVNTANPGFNYHRLSPEVQPLARKLYQEASQALASGGFLPSSATSSNSSNDRTLYLSGLDNLSMRALTDRDLAPATKLGQLEDEDNLAVVKAERRGSAELIKAFEPPVGNILMETGRMTLSSPQSDMQMAFSHTQRSHYQSSFQQMRLLGKGGFGKVYHAYNIFDKKEYAVKKIPLSPRLSERYRQSGHQELESVLREVQALAQLEHRNCVRYHACWVEEPQLPVIAPQSTKGSRPNMKQRLLTNRAHVSDESFSVRPQASELSSTRDQSDGILFGYDSDSPRRSKHAVPVVEEVSAASVRKDESSGPARESEIFTDGHVNAGSDQTDSSIDHSVYVLHVQMSLYPLTLTQYLSAPPVPLESPPLSSPKRHCFHLVPSLRILLGILCGLQYIHAKGLIHRDIKPGNIFLSTLNTDDNDVNRLAASEGFVDVGSCPCCPNSVPFHVNPRIGDFGLVAELVKHADRSGSQFSSYRDNSATKQVGTELYRPPHGRTSKIVDGHVNGTLHEIATIDEKLDVYALGIILVEMLCPFSTTSERAHILRDLQKGKLPVGLAASIDAELAMLGRGHDDPLQKQGLGWRVEECISGMINEDATERWSCVEVQEALEGILKSYLTGTLLADSGTKRNIRVDRRRVQTLSDTNSED